jgi:hypothetical protein
VADNTGVQALITTIRTAGALRDWIAAALHGRRQANGSLGPFTPKRWERESLASLRETILGNRKQTIAAALGAPRTALATEPGDGYLHCNLWYYPLCREARWCMAVRFDSGIARRVEFFCGLVPPNSKCD